MRNRQLGIGLGGLLVGAAILIVVALLGLKLAPSYIEFYTIQKVLGDLSAQKRGGSVAEIRKAFDARAVVDNISDVKADDLEITKEGGELVINAVYRKDVPLFGNMGIYINFAASSRSQ